MSTDRSVRLSPADLALKHASAEAVRAAGGQTFMAGETNRAQSRFSDWCSPHTAEFMPIDIVRDVEARSVGTPGHPHITRALARAAGVPVSASTSAPQGMDDLGDWMGSLSKEFADVVGELCGEDLAQGCACLSPNARADIRREAGHLIERLQQLCSAIDSS